MTRLTLILLCALAGCASEPTVVVPVHSPCEVAEPPVPAYRFNPPYDSVFEGTTDLLGDRLQALAYEEELRAALRSCR